MVMSDEIVNNEEVKDEALLLKKIEGLESKIAALEEEKDENGRGWQRAKADFVNYKKDESARVQDLIRFGLERLIRDILGVVDSFDLALQSMRDDEASKKGFLLIKNQLEDVLKRHGVEKIVASPGESLDLLKHEPLLEVQAELAPGLIVELITPGFSLFDKVIRPAKVSISKGQT